MQPVRLIPLRLVAPALAGLAGCMALALLAAPPTAARGEATLVDGPVTFLGVGTARADEGLRVTHVVRGSAAEAAGLRKGDVIVTFDGRTVEAARDLRRLVRDRDFGDAVDITVLRDGSRELLTAELGRRDEGPRLELDRQYWVWTPHMRGRVEGEIGFDGQHGTTLEDVYLCPGDEDCAFGREPVWYRGDCVGSGCPTFVVRFHERPMLGVEVVETTPELSRHLGGERGGVLIGKVLAGSPAEAAGVEVGDLIVAVGGSPTEDRRQLSRAIRDGAGDEVELEVIRDGRPVRLSAWIEAAGPSGPQR